MSLISKLVGRLAVTLGLAFFAHASWAHQQKEAYVTVLFNQQSGQLEVSHRLLLHDANHALRRHFDVEGDLAVDQATQSFFASYLQSRFGLYDSQLTKLDLSTVGFEVEGKYFWVYQETTLQDYDQLTVENTSLHEVWPKQINHVNIEKSGIIRSARLSQDKPRAQINLIGSPTK